MHKLFKKHYDIFFKRTLNYKEAATTPAAELNKFKRNKDFKDGDILHRFPKKELRYFVRSECPTERPSGKKEIKSYEVIKASKRLRFYLNIPENFTCSRCTKKETCKFRDIIPPNKSTSVSDLLIMLNGLHNYESVVYPEISPKQGIQASETNEEQTDIEAFGRDEDFNKEEFVKKLQEEDREEQDDSNLSEEENVESEAQEKENEQLNDRYTHKTWDSALKLIDTLYPILEDITFRKGSGCKQYISTYITENKKLAMEKNQSNEYSEDEDTAEEVRFKQDKYQKKERNSLEGKREGGSFKKNLDATWGTKPINQNFESRARVQRFVEEEGQETDEDESEILQNSFAKDSGHKEVKKKLGRNKIYNNQTEEEEDFKLEEPEAGEFETSKNNYKKTNVNYFDQKRVQYHRSASPNIKSNGYRDNKSFRNRENDRYKDNDSFRNRENNRYKDNNSFRNREDNRWNQSGSQREFKDTRTKGMEKQARVGERGNDRNYNQDKFFQKKSYSQERNYESRQNTQRQEKERYQRNPKDIRDKGTGKMNLSNFMTDLKP